MKFWAVGSMLTGVMRKTCFMASIVLPWQRHLTKCTQVKFEHLLPIYTGVIAILYLTVRDALPRQQLLRKTYYCHIEVLRAGPLKVG